jgi:hypothetical protein
MPADIKNEERVVITAKISQQSANGWRHFCDGNGVSLTALLEVAGLELAQETVPPVVEARRQMIEAAREVDRLRRIRRR